MKLEWDSNKRKLNLKKHGIDFADAKEFFKNNPSIFSDNRKDYGENRYIGIGMLKERVMITVFTMRADNIRVISMRKANDRERKRYEHITN